MTNLQVLEIAGATLFLGLCLALYLGFIEPNKLDTRLKAIAMAIPAISLFYFFIALPAFEGQNFGIGAILGIISSCLFYLFFVMSDEAFLKRFSIVGLILLTVLAIVHHYKNHFFYSDYIIVIYSIHFSYLIFQLMHISDKYSDFSNLWGVPLLVLMSNVVLSIVFASVFNVNKHEKISMFLGVILATCIFSIIIFGVIAGLEKILKITLTIPDLFLSCFVVFWIFAAAVLIQQGVAYFNTSTFVSFGSAIILFLALIMAAFLENDEQSKKLAVYAGLWVLYLFFAFIIATILEKAINDVNYLTHTTGQLIYLLGIILSVFFWVAEDVFHSTQGKFVGLGTLLILVIFSVYKFSHPKTVLTQKKVDSKTETKEVQNIKNHEKELQAKFNREVANQQKELQATFNRQAANQRIVLKNPKTGQTEVIKTIADSKLRRIGQSDTVEVVFSLALDIPTTIQSTYQTEFTGYGLGRYNYYESRMTNTLLDIVRVQIDSFLYQHYLQRSRSLDVTVTGSADSFRIGDSLYYKGEYGHLDNTVFEGDHSYRIQLSPNNRIKTNHELAFLRAISVMQYLDSLTKIKHFVPTDDSTLHRSRRNLYKTRIYKQNSGGTFRKVEIILHIEDPNLPNRNPPKTPQKEPKQADCWLCRFILLLTNVALPGCGTLLWYHHRKMDKNPAKRQYHVNWQIFAVISFVVIALLTIWCQ